MIKPPKTRNRSRRLKCFAGPPAFAAFVAPKGLVHRLISGRHIVGFKRVWMLGVSEERIRCDTSRTSNDADGPFSSQPGGPMALGRFSVRPPPDSVSRTDLSMLVARALKIGQSGDGGMPPTYETMHYQSLRKCEQLVPIPERRK